MKISVGNNTVDVEQARPVLEAATELNAQIIDQNTRFSDIQIVFKDEPDILTLAERSIADEQQETFTDLAETGRSSGDLYKLVGSLALAHAQELDETQAATETMRKQSEAQSKELELLREQREAAEKTKFDEILGNIQRLAPKALDEVKLLLDGRLKGAASGQEIKDLEGDISLLLTNIEAQEQRTKELITQKPTLDELDQQVREPWALPQALIKVLGHNTTQWAIIDELPVEPKLSPSGHGRFAALRERHIDQPEASIYTALYLSDHVGETVAVDDIAGFLYSSEIMDSVGDHKIRSRVTSLLGPGRDYVQTILMDEGYLLQYGWRRRFEKSGNDVIKLGPRYRIYRAVAFDDLGALKVSSYEHDDLSDEFQVTPEIAELLVDLNNKQETEVLDQPPISEKPRQPRQANIPETRYPLPPPADAREKPTQAPNQSRGRKPSSPELKSILQWVKKFNEEIDAALAELEEEGLLISYEGESIKVARTKSSKGTFATAGGIDRLVDAGYLKSFEHIHRSSWPNLRISPEEMVVMRLFNTHTNLLGKGAKRRSNALALIDQAVEAYFEKHPERKAGIGRN